MEDNTIEIVTLLTLFFITFIFTGLYLFFIKRSKLNALFIDKPNERKIHQIQIPRIGGFAFILAMFSVVLFLWAGHTDVFNYFAENSLSQAIGFSAVLIFILGFFDDTILVDVGVGPKFGVQFLIAFIIVYYFKLNFSNIYLLGHHYEIGYVGEILSVIWIVGVMNALNIIDGIDGLSAGVTLVAIVMSSLVFLLSGHGDLLKITVPLGGLVIGFLMHNKPPASLFAGDTGSLFFGVVVAVLSVKIGTLANDGIETITAFFITALPVMEVGVSIARRYTYAINDNKNIKDSLKQVVTPDNLHMHHRLIFKGYSHEQALRFLLFFSISLSSSAIILAMTNSVLLNIGVVFYSLFFLIMVLRRLGYGKKTFEDNNHETNYRKWTIGTLGDSGYFDHSIRHYASGKYWIKCFENAESLGKRVVDIYIVYDDKIDNVRSLSDSLLEVVGGRVPVIVITDDIIKSGKMYKDNRVYLVKRPVDMPYLLHDVEKIIVNENGDNSIIIDDILMAAKRI